MRNRIAHSFRSVAVAAIFVPLFTGCATIWNGRDEAGDATRDVIAGLERSESEEAKNRYRELSGHVRNFGIVEPDLYRGARPDRVDLLALRDAGVKTVIDFRHDPEEIAAEAAACRDLGLAYYNLPWSGHEENIDPRLIESFLDIVRHETNRPAFVHCQRGAERTGTMMAVYRMEMDGWPAERALEEMERYRYRKLFFPHLKSFVLDYEDKYRSIDP